MIPSILADPVFQVVGAASGRHGARWWAVIDPERHPLYVWQSDTARPSGYADIAAALQATVYTNGPLMGKRLGRTRKLTKRLAVCELVTWPAIGTAIGALLGRPRLPFAVVGNAAASVQVWRRIFTNWLPCGFVVSEHHNLRDLRDFDAEGVTHAWIGRSGTAFASYAIGDGQLPHHVREGIGGVLRLVRDFAPVLPPPSNAEHAAHYAELYQKAGNIAWGLIPLKDQPGLAIDGSIPHPAGLLVVAGSRTDRPADLASWLCAIGTGDAVVMDQRGSLLLGSGRRNLLRPARHRQAMQAYGLYCRVSSGS